MITKVLDIPLPYSQDPSPSDKTKIHVKNNHNNSVNRPVHNGSKMAITNPKHNHSVNDRTNTERTKAMEIAHGSIQESNPQPKYEDGKADVVSHKK